MYLSHVQPYSTYLPLHIIYLDPFFVCSGLPGSSSVHEAGALQLSPVDPEERLSEAGTIPGGQTRMVLGSDGDKDRSGKKLNPKLKYLASFRYGTL